MTLRILIRGGGDLASGVALRLIRCGCAVMITEISKPLTVRRSVSFSEVVFSGSIILEGFAGRLASNYEEAAGYLSQGIVPVIIDPQGKVVNQFHPDAIVDARMMKRKSEQNIDPQSPFTIGLGPGFVCGVDCHAIVETKRGHYLGRVIWKGSAEKDTGLPDSVMGKGRERVLRSPGTGLFSSALSIGDPIFEGQTIFTVGDKSFEAPFSGILRGLLKDGMIVEKGLKVGDIDPRDDPDLVRFVSDKALSIGGGVLEAILSCDKLRSLLP